MNVTRDKYIKPHPTSVPTSNDMTTQQSNVKQAVDDALTIRQNWEQVGTIAGVVLLAGGVMIASYGCEQVIRFIKSGGQFDVLAPFGPMVWDVLGGMVILAASFLTLFTAAFVVVLVVTIWMARSGVVKGKVGACGYATLKSSTK